MEPQDDQPLFPQPATPFAAEPQRRRLCTNCDRPLSVCLCHVLPSNPIPTTTHIIILHHPHETRHKLSTVPVLTKCLHNTTTIVGRRLPSSLSSSLISPALYLFPPTPSKHATPITHLAPIQPDNPGIVLIVFDGTWKHAKEMVSASEEVLAAVGAVRVCLDTDRSMAGSSIYDSELVLRKEPFGGCVSTMEAVARCLGVLEPQGTEIAERLVRVLREMVRLQAGFLKPMKPRVKIRKKGKEKEESEASGE